MEAPTVFYCIPKMYKSVSFVNEGSIYLFKEKGSHFLLQRPCCLSLAFFPFLSVFRFLNISSDALNWRQFVLLYFIFIFITIFEFSYCWRITFSNSARL